MPRAEKSRQLSSRSYGSTNTVFNIPPSFPDLYHEILTDPGKVEARITDSILYSPEDFTHFGYMISEGPSKIKQALGEVEEYASEVGKLISKNTVGLEGDTFKKFFEFANVLKFYNERIGKTKEMAKKYKKGDQIGTITTSLSNIKFLLTQLESDVNDFLEGHKKPKK